MSRPYPTVRALNKGEVVELEGIRFVKDEGELQPGDLYIGERNTGPHLLTVAEVVYPKNLACNAPWVSPTTNHYPYDIPECVKVREAD